ncbi:MAG TPA: outer membrane lipoprotein-sorting protein [Gemmatimonadales bacterium]|nr:outer membrane lipoprotein-sorting protein [Gemmatimonadales bacterium]
MTTLRRIVSASCTVVLLAGLVAPLRAQTAREIVDKVDRLLRGNSSRGTATMEVVTAHFDRTMEMRVWSLGTSYALIRILAPAKDAGTATLKVNNEIWNYLPRVDRTIRLPASLMSSSWMGSHFTNDDLVKEDRLVDDYDIVQSFDGVRDGEAVWEFTLTPKPDAAVVWGKIVERIRKRDLMPIWGKYYDADGTLIRTMTFSDYRTMGGRLVPATMEVVPADKPNEHTILHYESLEFNVGLTSSFFSLQRLRSGR